MKPLLGGWDDAGARAAVRAEETGQGTQVLPVGGKGKEAYAGFAAGGPARAGSSSGGDFEGAGREPVGALPAGAERAAGNDLGERAIPGSAGDGLPSDLCERVNPVDDLIERPGGNESREHGIRIEDRRARDREAARGAASGAQPRD